MSLICNCFITKQFTEVIKARKLGKLPKVGLTLDLMQLIQHNLPGQGSNPDRLDAMVVYRGVNPRSKFAATHLCTWVERGSAQVKSFAQQHNTMSPAQCTYHESSITNKKTIDKQVGFCESSLIKLLNLFFFFFFFFFFFHFQ